MSISNETWAIVAATGLGPIVAVCITFWRDSVQKKFSRRFGVFRTLMATRKAAISAEHVNALNLVEVDFYKCQKVEIAWKEYKNHLNDNSKPEDDVWREKKETLLAKMLSEMGAILGYKIPAMELFRGGYTPSGWAHRDMRSTGALEYIFDLSQGKKTLPMSVLSFPVSQEALAKQILVQDALLKTLSGDQPLKIKSEDI